MLETSNFVHWSAIRSLSLVMSECSLSGRGRGHRSNFYIVDLEKFATASRRYTGDIHNSTVVGLFVTPICSVLCSLAVLDPRVGHTMDVRSPFVPVLCHSD